MSIDARKKPRGRPPVDTEELRARVDRELIDAIDAWAARQPDQPARAEAIRRLLKLALNRA